MKSELRRIEPLRAANIGALVYGLMMGAFALLFLPFFILIVSFTPSSEMGAGGPAFLFMMLLLYPIMGVVMGWVSGLLGSAIYNFVIRATGGLLIEFDHVEAMGDVV